MSSTDLRLAERMLGMCVEARAEAVLSAREAAAVVAEMARLRSLVPAVRSLCGDVGGSAGSPCALPTGHQGWHASNPTYDAERSEVHGGAVWTPARDGYQLSH